MLERRIGNKIIQEYSSLLDFVEYAEGSPYTNGHSRDNSEDRVRFTGGTWQDAVSQAKTGNPELVTELFNGVNIINAMIEEDRIGEIRDVTGEYFDVADFLSGEPEVFRRDDYGDQRPVVPVYANFAMNCRTSNTVIKNRGCGIIALCDELAKSGFIVDLNMCKSDEYGRKVYYTKIKLSLDPLDLDSAAFIVANPMCHRRLWCSILERCENSSNCGNYGYPGEYDLDEIFATGLSGFYFTSSNHSLFSENQEKYKTLEGTKNHILDMVAKFKEKAEQVVLG
jgi:hypothetical protein